MEDKIQILVVEDDPIISEDLQGIISDFGYTALEPVADASSALKAIRTYKPDLCLLDIHLGSEIDGIRLSKMIRDEWGIPFVFLTAFNDRDTIEKIKETGAKGYLVKPVNEHNLQAAIEMALVKDDNEPPVDHQAANSTDSIFIKVKDRLMKFKFDDIQYFEAYDNYAFLYTHDKKHILSSNLKQIEERLTGPQFLRIHRSFIVNLEKVEGIGGQNVMVGKKELPIGKTYRDVLLNRIDLL
jgi:DNA-binding LytR/AlgR family response regulator